MCVTDRHDNMTLVVKVVLNPNTTNQPIGIPIKSPVFTFFQDYTVQCVLPINLFNEKIFTFLWFWFVLVAIVTCMSFLIWFYRVFFRRNRVTIVKKYLKISEKILNQSDKKLCKRFADQHLRDDGIFLLRIIEKNSNDILMTDLVTKMWGIYSSKPMIRKEQDGDQNGETYE